jgi:hypothetical protein
MNENVWADRIGFGLFSITVGIGVATIIFFR